LKPTAIAYADARRLQRALQAGIAYVLARRDQLNHLNVYPVADHDTGTNLAATLREVLNAIDGEPGNNTGELLIRVAEAALDGARGNSGAIMAQYFQGLSDGARRTRRLGARRLAAIARRGAHSAWQAMAEPQAGTLPSVLDDFAAELVDLVRRGLHDLRALLDGGLERARRSLAATMHQLPALEAAGVVDAGAQGFVDFLEGITHYMHSGRLAMPPAAAPEAPGTGHTAAGACYRYCTECLIHGRAIDRAALTAELGSLAGDSLIVAGSGRRVRIHIHTDSPNEVYLVARRYGELARQKADDMQRQQRLIDQPGQVAIVTDSGADLPAAEAERLGVHLVPLRLMIGDNEYLDRVSLEPGDFYRLMTESEAEAKTSQPPASDFRRQYELLTGHDYDVVTLCLSARLSGTYSAAQAAAQRAARDRIEVIDTRNAAAGQGLLVLHAAEVAAAGADRAAVLQAIATYRDLTRTYALIHDLGFGVRGGRVKPWMKRLADFIGLKPVLANSPDGRLVARGVLYERGAAVESFGRWLQRRMAADKMYRVMISHTAAPAAADQLRTLLLAGKARIEACWITETSPAVAVHAGPGALVAALQERP